MKPREQYEQHRDYIEAEGLNELIDMESKLDAKTGVMDSVSGDLTIPFPPQPAERDRLQQELQAAREADAAPAKIDSLENEQRVVASSILRLMSSAAFARGDDDQAVSVSSLRELLEQLLVERKRVANRVNYFEERLENFRNTHPNISEDILRYTQLQR